MRLLQNWKRRLCVLCGIGSGTAQCRQKVHLEKHIQYVCTVRRTHACPQPFRTATLSMLLRMWSCSETMVTGESQFNISTPQEIWTRVPCVRTSETWWEWSEIAGSPQGSPPAADSVGCEAGRETCRERETRTEKLCEIKWDYHIVSTRPSDGSGRGRHRRGHNDQSRRGHQSSETTLTGESRFHISTPLGFRTWVPCDGKQTGPVRHGENEVRLQVLHSPFFLLPSKRKFDVMMTNCTKWICPAVYFSIFFTTVYLFSMLFV